MGSGKWEVGNSNTTYEWRKPWPSMRGIWEFLIEIVGLKIFFIKLVFNLN